MITRARRDAGREDEPFEIGTGLGRDLAGVRRCQDLGVTRVVAGPTPNSTILTDTSLQTAQLRREDFLDWTKRFADEVIANF